MNKSEKCSCGEKKGEFKPFCDLCWNDLPSATQDRIVQAGQMIRDAGEMLLTAHAKAAHVVNGAELYLRLQREGKI